MCAAAMKLALCIVFFVFAVAAQDDKECTFGQMKSEDCNSCMCTVSGQWACTMMKCRVKRDATCTPGMEFKEQCNMCECGEDGTSAHCTTNPCDDD